VRVVSGRLPSSYPRPRASPGPPGLDRPPPPGGLAPIRNVWQALLDPAPGPSLWPRAPPPGARMGRYHASRGTPSAPLPPGGGGLGPAAGQEPARRLLSSRVTPTHRLRFVSLRGPRGSSRQALTPPPASSRRTSPSPTSTAQRPRCQGWGQVSMHRSHHFGSQKIIHTDQEPTVIQADSHTHTHLGFF